MRFRKLISTENGSLAITRSGSWRSTVTPLRKVNVNQPFITIAGQNVPRGIKRVGGRDSQVARIDGSDERVDADVAIVDTGIGALDTFVGYHPQLEDAILPQPSDLAQAMRELKRY